MYEILEEGLTELVNYAILGFEFVGIVVLIISGCQGVYNYIKKNPKIRLYLAEGMALSLEFKLGSEILRTVIVRQLSELVFVAGIIILRASLTWLIHWEIGYEERQERQKNNQKILNAVAAGEMTQEEASLQLEANCAVPKKEGNVVERMLDKRFKNDEMRKNVK